LLAIAVQIAIEVGTRFQSAEFFEELLRLVDLSLFDASPNAGGQNLAASDEIEHSTGKGRDETLGREPAVVIDDAGRQRFLVARHDR
jgi:hypothetical protein